MTYLAPTGDPAVMRRAAAELRMRVDTWTDVAATVDTAVAGATFVGPAADRYRSETAAASSRMRAACDGVLALADRITREAHRIETEQAAAARTGLY